MFSVLYVVGIAGLVFSSVTLHAPQKLEHPPSWFFLFLTLFSCILFTRGQIAACSLSRDSFFFIIVLNSLVVPD
jgi:hypothetical protein